MGSSNHQQVTTVRKSKKPSEKQIEFRKQRKDQGLERAEAFYRLMCIHRLNLPELDDYINTKDENGQPLNSDVDSLILPNPTKVISRSRIHQILMRVPEYMANSSWKTTRQRVSEESTISKAL